MMMLSGVLMLGGGTIGIVVGMLVGDRLWRRRMNKKEGERTS